MTSPLLTPWHDLDRLARAAADATAKATEAAQRSRAEFSTNEYDARAEAESLTHRALQRACTPERILSLLDAAARGAEDTARIDYLEGCDGVEWGSLLVTARDDSTLRRALDAARAVPPALDGPAEPV